MSHGTNAFRIALLINKGQAVEAAKIIVEELNPTEAALVGLELKNLCPEIPLVELSLALRTYQPAAEVVEILTAV